VALPEYCQKVHAGQPRGKTAVDPYCASQSGRVAMGEVDGLPRVHFQNPPV
jgi:hypothetical protein